MEIDIPAHEDEWPTMRFVVRAHEVVDMLRRDVLPEPYRSIRFPSG